MSLVDLIVTAKLPVAVAMVSTPWPTGSVREEADRSRTCSLASWRTSTEADRPPSRAPAMAEAVKTLGSETLGWLNRLPPPISDVQGRGEAVDAVADLAERRDLRLVGGVALG